MMLLLVVILAQMPTPNAPIVDMRDVAIFEGARLRGQHRKWSCGGTVWGRMVCQ